MKKDPPLSCRVADPVRRGLNTEGNVFIGATSYFLLIVSVANFPVYPGEIEIL